MLREDTQPAIYGVRRPRFQGDAVPLFYFVLQFTFDILVKHLSQHMVWQPIVMFET